jgi:hypothetical protein
MLQFKSIGQEPTTIRNVLEHVRRKSPSFLRLVELLIFTRASIKIVPVKEPFRQSVRRFEGPDAQIDVVPTLQIHRFTRIPWYRYPSPSSSSMHGVEVFTPQGIQA